MVAAIVLAGGSPATDELLRILRVGAKSLLKIGDKEMVRYVVDALLGSGRVERLIIFGLEPDSLPGLVPAGFPVEFIPNQPDVVAGVLIALERLADEKRVLICSADIPLLTSEAVVDFLDRCERLDIDVGYPIVERSVMEARFPGSGRSYRALRDGSFAGGDMFWVNPRLAMANRDMASQLVAARKSGFRVVRMFGLKMILRYLTRRLTIAEAEKKAARIFNCRCKAIISQYPEIGMDVDKLHQYQMVRAVLEGARA